MKPVGLILAGGASLRMGGGDKCLLPLNGRPVLGHVIERILPQVSTLVLNANGDVGRFAAWPFSIIGDGDYEGRGPLAGILAGLKWCREFQPDVQALLSVPADAPFLPRDLAKRLDGVLRATGFEIVVAASSNRTHWVTGLWSLTLLEPLREKLGKPGSLKVEDFVRSRAFDVVSFGSDPFDRFLNINSPADLENAAGIATSAAFVD